MSEDKSLNKKSILFFWGGKALFRGNVVDNTTHQHHAAQIVISIKKDFKLFYDNKWSIHRGVIIAPDVPHQLLSSDHRQLLLLIDHETKIAKRLSEKLLKGSNVKSLDDFLARTGFKELISRDHNFSCHQANILFNKIIDFLLGSEEVSSPAIDSRIKKALDIMKGLHIKKASTKEIARSVCLSESRFIHLFSEQIGIPVRRYLLWLRIAEGITNIVDDPSLTDAAHNLGFADSAHFSRTFRRIFGMKPSKIFKNSQFIQVISCLN